MGTDKHGVPYHIHKRSTNSQGKSFKVNVEGSRPQYSFHHTGKDSVLYVFEAPIGMLSFLTLYSEGWQEHSYVALCGTGGQAPSRKNCREQGTTAVSCSLRIKIGTMILFWDSPWPALPWTQGRACSPIHVPEPYPARQGDGALYFWTGPRFTLDHQEGHTLRRS